MECQNQECTNKAKEGGMLCKPCRDWIDGGCKPNDDPRQKKHKTVDEAVQETWKEMFPSSKQPKESK